MTQYNIRIRDDVQTLNTYNIKIVFQYEIAVFNIGSLMGYGGFRYIL